MFVGYLRNVPNLERPVQCFAPSCQQLVEWAKEILKGKPGARVEIYEQVEKLRKTVRAKSSK